MALLRRAFRPRSACGPFEAALPDIAVPVVERHAGDAASTAPARVSITGNWEWLRVLSFLDIAFYHWSGRHLFWIGLPTFMILSLTLSARRPVPLPTGEFAMRRLKRLMIPWLFWSAVYAIIQTLQSIHHGHAPLAWSRGWVMVVLGPRLHLWFVPFIIVAGLVVNVADRLTQRISTRALVIACLLAMELSVFALDVPALRIGDPFERWLFALPAIPLGLVLGRLSARSPSPLLRRRLLVVLAGALAGAALIPLLRRGEDCQAALRYVGCLAVLMGTLALPRLNDPVIGRITPLLFGAYLIHPLVEMELIDRLIHPAGRLTAGLAALMVEAAVTLALTWALRRTAMRRFL